MIYQNQKLFSKICQLASILRSTSIVWNKSDNKLGYNTGKGKNFHRNLNYRIHLHSLATLTVFVQVVFGTLKTSKGDGYSSATSKSTSLVNGLAAIILLATNVHLNVSRKQSSDFVLYFDGLLEFSKRHEKGKRSNRDLTSIEKLNLLFATAMYFTGMVLPIAFVYGLHWHNPCKPSLAGYWLIDQCSAPTSNGISLTVMGTLLKLIVLLFNHWLWTFAYSMTVLVISGVQILGGCLETYWRAHNRNSDYRQKSVEDIGLIYRTIQLLATLTNVLQQGAYMTVLTVAATIIQAISSTTLIKLSWNASNLAPLLVFTMTFIDATLACVVCLGGMAGVYLKSCHVSRSVAAHLCRVYSKPSGQVSRKVVRWMRRFSWSCAPIKIRFGGFNFVDELTPLNCINMANNLTVQFLLLGL